MQTEIKKYTCRHCGGIVKGSFKFEELVDCNKECEHCYVGTVHQREKRKDVFIGTPYTIPKSEFKKHIPKPRKDYKGPIKRLTKKEQEQNRKNSAKLKSLFG